MGPGRCSGAEGAPAGPRTGPRPLSPSPWALRSVTKEDYVWDEEEIAFMKAQGEFEKNHIRRRDKFTHYVEAAAQHNNRMRAAREKMGHA